MNALGRRVVHGMIWLSGWVLAASGEDWPTYMHDYPRSGVTGEVLGTNLVVAWTYPRLPAPRPAWLDEPKYDYFVGSQSQKPLKPRVVFDRANHVAVVEGRVYVGSSADHAVRCLRASTGEPLWIFFAGGPVRAAPTVAGGRVYFGGDDGCVYCLEAADGTLVWKVSPAGAANRLVPNNGRFVSPFAVRSGVAVEGGVAYVAAGVFPSEGVYLCALDAATGQTTAGNHWRKRFTNLASFQGYLLLSPTRVYVPGGRSNPFYFDRASGNLQGQYNDRAAAGTFALLAGNSLFFGPAGRSGAQITEGGVAGDNLAVYPDANALVVKGNRTYVLTDTLLMALDRTTRAVVWSRPCACPNALICAGGTLYAAGPGVVTGFAATNGGLLWTGAVDGAALGLAVAGGRLFVSTDGGLVSAFVSPDGDVDAVTVW